MTRMADTDASLQTTRAADAARMPNIGEQTATSRRAESPGWPGGCRLPAAALPLFRKDSHDASWYIAITSMRHPSSTHDTTCSNRGAEVTPSTLPSSSGICGHRHCGRHACEQCMWRRGVNHPGKSRGLCSVLVVHGRRLLYVFMRVRAAGHSPQRGRGGSIVRWRCCRCAGVSHVYHCRAISE